MARRVGGRTSSLTGDPRMTSAGDRQEVCDASKEMKEIVSKLVETLGNEHRREQERERSFSVKDLTVPLVFFVPMLLGIITAFFQIQRSVDEYVKTVDSRMVRIETTIDKLSEVVRYNAADRFKRNDLYIVCLKWQNTNPDLRLGCQELAFSSMSFSGVMPSANDLHPAAPPILPTPIRPNKDD